MMPGGTAAAPAGELAGAMDALFRFGAGVDHGDADLLATAFSDDAVVDFGPCGRRMGLEFPLPAGRETIVGFLRAKAGTQATTHVVTNGRAHVEGDVARLRALVDATPLPKGDHSRRCRTMNRYDVDLARDDLWRMSRLVVSSAWLTGDTRCSWANGVRAMLEHARKPAGSGSVCFGVAVGGAADAGSKVEAPPQTPPKASLWNPSLQ
jgi:hypothetical protein